VLGSFSCSRIRFQLNREFCFYLAFHEGKHLQRIEKGCGENEFSVTSCYERTSNSFRVGVKGKGLVLCCDVHYAELPISLKLSSTGEAVVGELRSHPQTTVLASSQHCQSPPNRELCTRHITTL
jgi:hypothetical protein